MPKRKVQVWIYGRNSEQENLVLMLKTRPGRGEFWQPVTGSVEEGESLLEAALREATEETGIAFQSKPEELGSFEFDGQWGRAFEQAYALEAPTEAVGAAVTIDPHEHTAFQWVTPEEALKLTHFESNRKILEQWILINQRRAHGSRN